MVSEGEKDMKIKVKEKGITLNDVPVKEFLEYFGYKNIKCIDLMNGIYEVDVLGINLPSVEKII